jgi:hypothetical protein
MNRRVPPMERSLAAMEQLLSTVNVTLLAITQGVTGWCPLLVTMEPKVPGVWHSLPAMERSLSSIDWSLAPTWAKVPAIYRLMPKSCVLLTSPWQAVRTADVVLANLCVTPKGVILFLMPSFLDECVAL